MSLLRPSCAALARRICTVQPLLDNASRSPILSLVHSYRRSPRSRPQCRAFSHNNRYYANVIATPQTPTDPDLRKRTVRIGMLPRGTVKDSVIQRIFKGALSATEGNNVLRILHHRRTTGSLADYGVDNLGKQYTHVSRELAMGGLEWLREHYPIDEARAAEEWAEKEANRISYELWLADPETESKYKDPARAFKEQLEKEEKERRQQEGQEQRIGILHVGKSQFERNIEEKRQARLDEMARKAEEREKNEREMEEKLATGEWVKTPTGTQLMKPGQTTYVDIFGKEQISRRKEEMEKYAKLSDATGATSEEELLAKTTLAQRLYPMTAFVFVTVLLCIGVAHYYAPPAPAYRLFPDLSLTTTTIGGLVIANAVIAVAWRIMPLWPFMTRYFMHVPGYPRAIQSVLNVFSHVQYEHLLANMMALALVGPACCDLVGRGTFMATYISAGAVGTLASLYWANLGRGSITAHSVGASAAIWGIVALYCLLTDQERLKIPFVKDQEVGFWPKTLFAAFALFELRVALKGRTKNMDHASHFGGMAVGMAAAGYMRATGFHEKKLRAGGLDSLQSRAGVEHKTVDVGAIAAQGAAEVKQSLVGSSK
ncbi:hypothetical protein IAQ61_005906 [Plenodomus lingam]|uniref:Peptidase S54 rhomboid domain-containing protein n=1 Tax=Leptosphaeria maculans (strain JN3 / isolate v23.1.3 / race Av1-4-5-6-7-8) TaxID=985895 RepID=E4ZLP2_LEPMJ|nr:hypothetical protein LEMA_P054280.1 [Plenodomus lingam JN3]KAH9870431.1 hypothetical protein IAQ61_005906 [Plenodomus lingam]CBX92722.1 hypothetical protein LEMA_P054280.1 [Plenodomus lingam JN3]